MRKGGTKLLIPFMERKLWVDPSQAPGGAAMDGW